MQVLSLLSPPFACRIKRRHKPREVGYLGGYREYMPCLRWDFGFTCAVCLLHESDYVPGPGLGGVGLALGAFTVEHLKPKSQWPRLANKYYNCIYACRVCNVARGTKPIVRSADQARLLNPCDAVWSSRFQWANAELVPKHAGDKDALYTIFAYDVNAPGKVALRGARAEAIEGALEDIVDAAERVAMMIELSDEPQNAKFRSQLTREAEFLRGRTKRAMKLLRRFAPMPLSAPGSCRCSIRRARSLPEAVQQQAMEVPD